MVLEHRQARLPDWEVLVLSLAAEPVSLWKYLPQVNTLRGDQSLWHWFHETRRSELLVVVAEDMAAGEAFTPHNLRSVRPGFGLAPKHYDVLLGKRVNRPLTKGTPVSWDLID